MIAVTVIILGGMFFGILAVYALAAVLRGELRDMGVDPPPYHIEDDPDA